MELVIENVSKNFGDKNVLNDLSERFEKGVIYGLLGRNGAGKTTLFSLIAREQTIDQGSIYLVENGEKITLQMEDIFFMLAEPDLPGFLSGREFVKFFIEANAERIKESSNPDDYFDLVGFEEDDKDRLIQGYSTGMRNKIQMIMFLILKPKVILMDEPLNSLDVVVQLEMKNLIKSIKDNHIIIFSTHILDLAKDMADEIVLLHRGQTEKLDKKLKEDSDFEDKIIGLLKS